MRVSKTGISKEQVKMIGKRVNDDTVSINVLVAVPIHFFVYW